MAVYYINQLLILGLAYPLCLRNPSKLKKAVYLAITFGYMWFLATFRINIGFDYFSYIEIFDQIKNTSDFTSILSIPYEPGFEVLTWLMTKFVPTSAVMYGVYSTLIFVPIALGIYWYNKNQDAWLATWLYVTLTFFYSSMNFVRQNLAIGVSFLAYRFLRDRKPIPYFLLILLAASFHRTALIMIPLYFLTAIPLNRITGIIYTVGTIVIYLLSPWIMDLATNFIFTQYKDTMYVDTAYGFSIIFLLLPTIILVACLSLYPIWKKRDSTATVLFYMMIFSWIIWLFITHHFILERFSHYPYILALIAVPAALSNLYASPDDYIKLERMSSSSEKSKHKSKDTLYMEKQLRQKISDHQKYYWSAVAALIIITWIYNEFGQHINGFHNVFPYQSYFTQG